MAEYKNWRSIFSVIKQQKDCMMTQASTHTSSFDELSPTAFVRQRTVEQLFACSPATVWRWVKKGFIPAPKKVSGITLWNVGELRAALEAVKGESA